MPKVTVRDDKKQKYQSFEAQWETQTTGGMGLRSADMTGFGATECESRNHLLDQAKAVRDELNAAIEQMIDELCRMAP